MPSSDSDLSDDEYEFEDYTNERYESGSGSPLIAKKARILAATTQNDVETLKELLDSPKWYRVRDNHGNNLLRIAVFRENEEVFDFLRSLAAFQRGIENVFIGDCYALELKIKRAVDVNVKVDTEGNTFLHCALSRKLIKASRLLIERGADLNAQNKLGKTPLHMALNYMFYLRNEAVSMLLYYGADPSIRDLSNLTPFDEALTGGWCISVENLFYFTVDEWSLYEAPGWALLKLAHKSKSAFKQLTELTSDVIYSDGKHSPSCFDLLMTVGSQCLLILLKKYPRFVKEVLQSYSEKSNFDTNLYKSFDLKNLDMLIQSSLSLDVIELISKVNSSKLIKCIQRTGKSKEEILEIIYYFLSYGMCLQEMDFQTVYKMTGYSEDFKNLLVMDVQEEPFSPITDMMPRLIYDVSLDVYKSIRSDHPYGFINWDWEGIFHYFAHPRVRNSYLAVKNRRDKRLPQIPLLQELARDSFRKYFIKIFKIRTAKQFYSLLRALPVSPIHKKIITYESRLY